MRKSILISTIIIPFLIVGCAKRPRAVVPVAMPSGTYASFSCEELAVELPKAQAEQTELSRKQTNTANADAVGVFLVAIPVGKLTGNDVEGDLAVAKGKVLAIQAEQISKKCTA